MTKIVYNNCYGGFSLSDKGLERFAELKGIKIYPSAKVSFHMHSYYTTPEAAKEEDYKFHFSNKEIERADPALAQTVEELGAAANGSFAALIIIELEPGTEYRIREYDGNEWVETPDDIEWKVA